MKEEYHLYSKGVECVCIKLQQNVEKTTSPSRKAPHTDTQTQTYTLVYI